MSDDVTLVGALHGVADAYLPPSTQRVMSMETLKLKLLQCDLETYLQTITF